MTKVLATKKSKLIPRIGRLVTIGEKRIALFQTTTEKVYALEDYCPLTDSPILEGIVSGDFLYEPMREYKISLVSGEIQEPDEGQLTIYPVEISGDDVYLEV
ncbi:nitrite reductase [Listeria sp. FSL L7-1485]|uniref:Nitrite reductase n=1 Tax=Listeria immobilis TaxID=2713502 RepID=A0A7X0X552_9LIST|nr:nitrite reductase (NAD(P)H) small subunit [Listeria immobilis]MBC1482147.1 nitrite reductase [Listeria immobilis]MBC1487821.1 nitrite reductase [Listeria immobilis]MBC1505538.1 nitrite reductase [Listeria immobilis]MBC1509029.1 nitrite reductase [Listeria immobilis]MBC1535280.1 nitrite reductase [Listeria immobilis]